MTDRTCECCGQTLPIVDGLNLPPMSEGAKQIVELVRRAGKHGIATDRLFNALYGQDRDGGPLSGTKVLHVRISAVNKLLRPRGLRISGEHTGSRHAYGRYHLIQIEELCDAADR